MTGSVAALLEVTVTGVPDVSVRMPVGVTVGVAVPPLLLKVTLASVLLPTSVSTEPPFSVTLLAAWICPALRFSTKVALFRTMFGFVPENGITA